MDLAISFTNLGPYHLARLRAAAVALQEQVGRLLVYETATIERRYPWQTSSRDEPFERRILFPNQALEDLSTGECAMWIEEALDRDRPDVVAVAGYVRPEAMSAARWARRTGRPALLLSESQEIDRPRQWWKEAVKRRRLRFLDTALVGGESHRDYLDVLGMPACRIALGYNAVDNLAFASQAEQARNTPESRIGLPKKPYFLSVCRFAQEKNLPALVEAYALYREAVGPESAWDLVLCGGGPEEGNVDLAVRASGAASAIHRPGFLQEEQLAPWYAFASSFVLSSVSEPWGLVINEAAACGLPLLVSERAGAAGTLVPEPFGTTGRRFDPTRVDAMADAMIWMATQPADRLVSMGRNAIDLVAEWGPERFASGLLDAVELAGAFHSGRKLARAS